MQPTRNFSAIAFISSSKLAWLNDAKVGMFLFVADFNAYDFVPTLLVMSQPKNNLFIFQNQISEWKNSFKMQLKSELYDKFCSIVKRQPVNAWIVGNISATFWLKLFCQLMDRRHCCWATLSTDYPHFLQTTINPSTEMVDQTNKHICITRSNDDTFKVFGSDRLMDLKVLLNSKKKTCQRMNFGQYISNIWLKLFCQLMDRRHCCWATLSTDYPHFLQTTINPSTEMVDQTNKHICITRSNDDTFKVFGSDRLMDVKYHTIIDLLMGISQGINIIWRIVQAYLDASSDVFFTSST